MIEITDRKVDIDLVCECGEVLNVDEIVTDEDETIEVECPVCGKKVNVNVKITTEE